MKLLAPNEMKPVGVVVQLEEKEKEENRTSCAKHQPE